MICNAPSEDRMWSGGCSHREALVWTPWQRLDAEERRRTSGFGLSDDPDVQKHIWIQRVRKNEGASGELCAFRILRVPVVKRLMSYNKISTLNMTWWMFRLSDELRFTFFCIYTDLHVNTSRRLWLMWKNQHENQIAETDCIVLFPIIISILLCFWMSGVEDCSPAFSRCAPRGEILSQLDVDSSSDHSTHAAV